MTTVVDANADERPLPTTSDASMWQRFNLRLRQITRPATELTDAEERRKARLLAYMSLSLAVILTIAGIISVFTSVFFPDPAISLGLLGTISIFLTIPSRS